MNARHIARIIRAALPAALFLVTMTLAAHACPNCGLEVIEGQKGGASLAQGFTYSIVGMASAPFLVFGSVATYIIRAYRRRRMAEEFTPGGMPADERARMEADGR